LAAAFPEKRLSLGAHTVSRIITILSAASPSAGVTEAANALCAKMREIHEDSRYLSVFTLHQLHHGPYAGPNYVDELAALEAALSAAKGE
jgi:hypothetical protein